MWCGRSGGVRVTSDTLDVTGLGDTDFDFVVGVAF